VIVATVLTGCGGSSAPAPGPIVFAGHPDGPGFNNILVMNPDGTGVRRLTRRDGDVAPSWSPDGTQIVFERAGFVEGCDEDTSCASIWIMGADGTGERRLTPVSTRSEAPDWSPDGDRILFHRWDPDGIHVYVMSVDGSGLRQLTDGPASDEGPVWSPDGKRIAFTREVDREFIESDVYVMNVDGTEQRRLTHDGYSYAEAWSPDGETISVTRGPDDEDIFTVAVVNADGSEERTLLPPGEDGSGPEWSPDGSQIAFIRSDVNLGESEIWVMDADGGNARKLPAGPYSEPHGLDWAAARD
jgi:TolB protein